MFVVRRQIPCISYTYKNWKNPNEEGRAGETVPLPLLEINPLEVDSMEVVKAGDGG